MGVSRWFTGFLLVLFLDVSLVSPVHLRLVARLFTCLSSSWSYTDLGRTKRNVNHDSTVLLQPAYSCYSRSDLVTAPSHVCLITALRCQHLDWYDQLYHLSGKIGYRPDDQNSAAEALSRVRASVTPKCSFLSG
ncbi:uncharacterized protein YALI1_E28397g [Yarrowia lipolytica]|uniref:Secreted protein n=1 Tax=Yarrowia lipolytica TaxID=4952 RepID=A0A1D8NJT8_YARLL|nr:hypothetical protein YALI1_E28397g [Yarrowia lipolytica]